MPATNVEANVLSLADRILATLYLANPHKEFATAEMVVLVWERYPREFGLPGYDHPDSNKVLTLVVGKNRGLRARGLLEKTGQNRYRLTEQGRERVQAISRGQQPRKTNSHRRVKDLSEVRQVELPTAHQLLVLRCLETQQPAIKDTAQFTDALRFWALEEDATPLEIVTSVDRTAKLLQECCHLLKDGYATIMDVKVTAQQARDMLALHEQLAAKFKRHLDLIRNRSTRSKP